MRQVILLRHGITEANRYHRYCGSTDLPLDPEALEEFRKNKPVYPDCRGFRVLTSGMLRTEQTLREIYGEIPHETEPDFREIDFGVFENKSYEELKDEPAYQVWITGDNETNICPGGESGSQMTRRVLEAWERLEGNVLLVSHGGVIAAIMAHLIPGEGRNRYQWQPKPFGGYRLWISDDRIDYELIP